MIDVTVFEYDGTINISVGESEYDISMEELEIAMDYDWYTIFANEISRNNLDVVQQQMMVQQIIEGLQSISGQYRDLY